MPEGPETHHVADLLNQALAGRPLHQVRLALPALEGYPSRLRGHRVEAFEAVGKALLGHFDNALTLFAHSQLTGVWRIGPPAQILAGAERARVVLVADDAAAALFAALWVEVWPSAEIAAHPFLSRLGPDVLAAHTTAALFAHRMQSAPFARRSLAALLLMQEFAAGMGNYLRSEVLFQARLAPQRKPTELAAAERDALAHALLEVPRRAYRAKFEDAAGIGEHYLAQTAPGFRFQVFERQGQPCPACGGPIVMQRVASRRLYLCPHCQH
ncbi:endonuclease VIII [Xanthomonas sp. AmX2]|uniref:endonuclease VIII n=1 Tax=Xanthomonas sp. TaxID=29446 RepID=UPI00197E4081|nr:endonuclease VIII [Xanthomonas sp.]MBN6148718.1 endonuclease VIII [Xanthomonas sp.]